MICPHCSAKARIPEYAEKNVYYYDYPVTINTLCCQKPVRVIPLRTYRLEKYQGDQKEDDWGAPL